MSDILKDLYITEVKDIVRALFTNSRKLLNYLFNTYFPFEQFRPQSFFDDSEAIYNQAIEFGEPLPFHVLVVYIAAFIDILEKRLKE